MRNGRPGVAGVVGQGALTWQDRLAGFRGDNDDTGNATAGVVSDPVVGADPSRQPQRCVGGDVGGGGPWQ